MKKIIYIFLTVSVLMSCQPTLRLVTGIKNPKVETKEVLADYLKKNKVKADISQVYALKDAQEFADIFNVIKRLPNFLFFDKNGKLLNPENKTNCISDINEFVGELDNLQEKAETIGTDSFTLDFIKSRMVNLDGNPAILPENKYYLVCFWGKFMGKSTIKKVATYVEAAQKRDDLTIVLLNFDQQPFWTDTIEFN